MHDTRERIVHIFNALIAGAPAGSFPNQVRFVADDKTAKAGRTEKRAMASADGETVFIVRALCDASDARMTGVLAHELAHVSLLQRGKEDHTEREADALAKSFWGHTIRYDEEDVQTIGPGTSPRPAHLDSRGSTRKSTRYKKILWATSERKQRSNPDTQDDRLAWKIAVGASQRMTSGRVDAHDAVVEEWKKYEDQDPKRELFRHARDILGKHSVAQLYAGLAARKSTHDDIDEQAERAAWQEAHEEGHARYNPSPKGTPTDINKFALNEYLNGKNAHMAPEGVITRVHGVDHSHLKRMVGAGWLEAAPGVKNGWVLSALGKKGMDEWAAEPQQQQRAAWQEAHEEGHARYNPSEAALSKTCPTCGARVGDPCRQVGPGGGQGGRPQSAENLGIAMVSIHAARKRARYNPRENPAKPITAFQLARAAARASRAQQRREWQRGDVMTIGKTQWILQRAEPGAASFWAYKWPSKKNKSYAILCFDDVCTVHEIGGSAQRISDDIASGPPVFVEHLEEGSW